MANKIVWVAISLSVVYLLLLVSWLVVRSDTVERYIASRVFGKWVKYDDPEHSILVWDEIRGSFPFSYEVVGARWRNQTCLDEADGGDASECVVVLMPMIDVRLHPLTFIMSSKMDIGRVYVPHVAVDAQALPESIVNMTKADADGPFQRRNVLSHDAGADDDGWWPQYDHSVHVHSFRIDRISVLEHGEVVNTLVQLLGYPKVLPPMSHTAIDVMAFGHGELVGGGGDFSLETTFYLLDTTGDLDREMSFVTGAVDGDVATMTMHITGELFHDGYKAYADARYRGPVRDADVQVVARKKEDIYLSGRLEKIGSSWLRCSFDFPVLYASVVGDLGDMSDVSLWPQNVSVRYEGHEVVCSWWWCEGEVYGQDVRLEANGMNSVQLVHAWVTANVTACVPVVGKASWYEFGKWAYQERPEDACVVLSSPYGHGEVEVRSGSIVRAWAKAHRSEYSVFGCHVQDIRGSLSEEEVSVTASRGWCRMSDKLSMHDVYVRVNRQGYWFVGDGTHVHMSGNASVSLGAEKSLKVWVLESDIYGWTVEGTGEEGVILAATKERVSLSTKCRSADLLSFGNLFVEGNPWTKNKWHRVEKANFSAEVDVPGGQGRIVAYASRDDMETMPHGVMEIHRAKREFFGYHVHEANGTIAFPSGLYEVVCFEETHGKVSSDGGIVLSATSVAVEALNRWKDNSLLASLEWTWGEID